MRINVDYSFDYFNNDEKSKVFEFFPDVFEDKRGSFSEVLKDYGEWNDHKDYPLWFSNTEWIRQINRSKSLGNVIRGCHAQKGIFCQGKLVESVYGYFLDIITDARPDSKTFGVSRIYLLDHNKQNKVWVPRGFLHAFISCGTGDEYPYNIFNYYVDNSYNKSSEICVNPKTIIPNVLESFHKMEMMEKTEFYPYVSDCLNTVKNGYMTYSEKDENGIDYIDFTKDIQNKYNMTGKVWYK